jgi:myo-inositol 2-dehydrogenase/D-chiro-inositol 1-dehydrogenase
VLDAALLHAVIAGHDACDSTSIDAPVPPVVDAARAGDVASGLPGARPHPAGHDLITDDAVDAVVVTSWGATHEEYVVASIRAGKPVFCEKPLATTKQACLRIIDAEIASGRHLVQVGFMRRYDKGYLELKAVLEGGGIGQPLLMHCAHRNPSVPPYGFTTEMMISDSAVHEIDVVRWLFGEEIVAASVFRPRRSARAAEDLQDPLIVLLEMASGVLVDVEVFVNAGYGYDIRSEIVALGAKQDAVVWRDGQRSSRVPADWRERFIRSYDRELQDWLDAASAGTAAGPGSWDGYAATVVADTCIEALRTGNRIAVPLRERPDFYTKA